MRDCWSHGGGVWSRDLLWSRKPWLQEEYKLITDQKQIYPPKFLKLRYSQLASEINMCDTVLTALRDKYLNI